MANTTACTPAVNDRAFSLAERWMESQPSGRYRAGRQVTARLSSVTGIKVSGQSDIRLAVVHCIKHMRVAKPPRMLSSTVRTPRGAHPVRHSFEGEVVGIDPRVETTTGRRAMQHQKSHGVLPRVDLAPH
jgi:hypothetical protein